MPGAEGANMDKLVIFLCDHQLEGGSRRSRN